MKKITALLLLAFSAALQGAFPSVTGLKKEILFLSRELQEARRLLKLLPDQKTISAIFQQKKKPLKSYISFWEKKKLTIARAGQFFAIYESPDQMALTDGRFIFTSSKKNRGRLLSLNSKGMRWLGWYSNNQMETASVPQAEELQIGKVKISRSRRAGEYLLSVTGTHGYGYRFSKNGILSFNKLTTPSLFSEMNWLKEKGLALLQAARTDIPGNIVSRILDAYLKKQGHPGYPEKLTSFTLNYFRKEAGLGMIAAAAPLSRAASGHARYIAANSRSGRNRPPHQQFPDGFGFTGRSVADRIKTAGFAGQAVELIGFEANPVSCIAEWMTTIHHRRSILASRTFSCGFGSAPFAYSDSSGVGVLLLGIRRNNLQKKIIWTGCSPIWPIWDGRESPRTVHPARGPYGPPFSLWSKTARSLQTDLPRLRFRTISFPGETHLLPMSPLPWGQRLRVITKKSFYSLKTMRYPRALQILDTLHHNACKETPTSP